MDRKRIGSILALALVLAAASTPAYAAALPPEQALATLARGEQTTVTGREGGTESGILFSIGKDHITLRDGAKLRSIPIAQIKTIQQGGRTITLAAESAPAKDAPHEPKQAPEKAGPPVAWEKLIEEKLNKKISFDFVETPLQDVVAFVSSLSDITIVLDPQAVKGKAPAVTLRVQDMRLGSALQWVCKLAGLTCVPLDGALFVTTAARARAAAREDGEGADLRKLPRPLADAMGKRITFDFVETPFQDVVAFLSSLADICLVVDPQAIAGREPTVTLRVAGMPLDQALRWVCRVIELTYTGRDGAVFITTPELAKKAAALDKELGPLAPARHLPDAMAKEISFDFVETPLPDVVAFLQLTANLNIIADPQATKGRELSVTLRVSKMRADSALRWVGRSVGMVCVWHQGALFFTTPETARALLKK